jgi:hypothetical protein
MTWGEIGGGEPRQHEHSKWAVQYTPSRAPGAPVVTGVPNSVRYGGRHLSAIHSLQIVATQAVRPREGAVMVSVGWHVWS